MKQNLKQETREKWKGDGSIGQKPVLIIFLCVEAHDLHCFLRCSSQIGNPYSSSLIFALCYQTVTRQVAAAAPPPIPLLTLPPYSFAQPTISCCIFHFCLMNALPRLSYRDVRLICYAYICPPCYCHR